MSLQFATDSEWTGYMPLKPPMYHGRSNMNQFVLDYCPVKAAQYQCDKHVVKQCTEQFQMIGSTLRLYGANDEMMPLTKKGTPLIGGYKNHPVTKWLGLSSANFDWAIRHGIALCKEYTYRYGKTHFCEKGIRYMGELCRLVPNGPITPFTQAVPDIYRNKECPVKAYRDYYWYNKRLNIQCEWNKARNPPHWWKDYV